MSRTPILMSYRGQVSTTPGGERLRAKFDCADGSTVWTSFSFLFCLLRNGTMTASWPKKSGECKAQHTARM